MEQILKKLFKKYYIYKIQTDWKEALKLIPEKDLKNWMDNELFKEIDECVDFLSAEVLADVEKKYDDHIWMEINDFSTKWEEAREAEEDKRSDDFWSADDEDEWPQDPSESSTMCCPVADEHCDCGHELPHVYSTGCVVGCPYSEEIKCVCVDKPKEVPEVPESIQETGGL